MVGVIIQISAVTGKFDKIFLLMANEGQAAKDALEAHNSIEVKGDINSLSLCNEP